MHGTRLLAMLVCVTLVAGGVAVGETVATDDLALTVDDAARVTGVRVSGTEVAGEADLPVVELADVTRGREFVAGTPVGGELADGLEVRFEGLQASATVMVHPGNGALGLSCELVGQEELPARGVLLRLNVPVDAVGWRWHDDMQTTRTIGPGEVYENATALRAWPDLPEWADQPSLRIGSSNRNFCTVLTGPVGVCLAAPLDRPCIFRTAYDPGRGALQIVYDLALSPDTDPPNRWSFETDLYACDPEWGFRSALQRYYELHRDVFDVHVDEPGMWMAFSPLSQIDNVNEFRFGLQEGAREVAYDDQIGVLDTIYLTHAGEFANIPDHDPEQDALPPHERLVEVMTEDFRARTGSEEMYPAVGLHDAEGRLDIRETRVYGHIIAQFNLAPELPLGQWLLDTADRRTERTRENSGGRLDGFYYDGLTSGLNYRAEHFEHSEAPPLWDPVAEKPVLNNFFSSCEWARAAAEHFHEQDQITMMNGAFGASFYVAPWLDVFGGETGLRISRERMNYARTITYHKPMLTLLKGNYEQVRDHQQIELFHKRALAYGIFPGFFDWSPSGLGPGGRYWAHPEYYERDRGIFRKYQPLVQTLATAGWEPVTHARSSDPGVFVERFGPADDGIVWLTLLNEDASAHATTLTIDASALGLDADALQCAEVLTGRAVELRSEGESLAADLTVEADGVAMLQLATAQQAASWRLRQCAETIRRGITMREIDADRPPVAFAWHPRDAGYGRERVDDGWALVFDGADAGTRRAWQWAMLFQPQAAPVTLRVRASAEGLEGDGRAGVYIRHAWVSPSFSHYDTAYLELPAGTYEAREFEHTIEIEHPLRAIYLRPEVESGLEGTLRIESITLEDEFAHDYVENGDFSRWYEPIPDAMQDRLAAGSRQLAAAVDSAREAVAEDLTGGQARQALLEVGSLSTRLRGWIHEEEAEKGCRRALREIETTERHLGVALLASLGIEAPTIDARDSVAVGDRVPVRVALEGAAELQTRLSLSVEGHAELLAAEGEAAGAATLRVPADAEPGEQLTLIGEAMVGPEDAAAPVRATKTLTVVRALTVGLSNAGTDPGTGAMRVHAAVRNNMAQAVEAQLALTAPEGWSAPPARTLELAAGARKAVSALIEPGEGAQAGTVEVFATATAGDAGRTVSSRMLFIPAEANLLRNPGFEVGMGGWSGTGNAEIDEEVAHGGDASLRLRNPNASDRSQVSQTVTLDQQRPCPILVRAISRGEDVSGYAGREYSLYVDIYYVDGTPLYGQIVPFEPGTTDWQIAEQIIEPEKPIRNVNVYLILRGRAGTAWFDDVAVMEDPRRRGNIAREAEVKVDSAYSSYDAEPITDGIVHPPEDAHWTDESWASAETPDDHWIELRFDQPRTIDRAMVHFSRDAGVPRSSQELALQVPDGDGWRTVATVRPGPLSGAVEIRLDEPVTAARFRVLQPSGHGPGGRRDLMWVREVELFAAQ